MLAIISLDGKNEEDKTLLMYLYEKIRKVDEEAAEYIDRIMNGPEGRFLSVIINCQEDINQSFLLGLNKALNRSGLSNLTPKTDFLYAVEVIENWQKNYPETYTEYHEKLKNKKISLNAMKAELLQFNREYLAIFKELYPKYYPKEVVEFFCELHCQENILKDIKAGLVGILKKDNEILGTGCYKDNHVTRVYVKPAFQKQGYGSYIMQCLENEIGLQHDTVCLDASLPASRLYEKRGYVTIKHERWNVENGVVQVATEAVMLRLVESGMSEEQAIAYLQTDEGQVLVQSAVDSMSEEQKEQIIAAAVASLTDEQKQQILQGAITSLTEEQKTEIRNVYIEKMMASEEVQAQINEAVRQVSEAAAQVSALKGQLDSYGAFYNGLVEYTDAVSSASIGASTLATGLTTLYTNTETLNTAVGDLHIAVGTLNDGTGELKSGTEEFVSKTDGMDTQVSDEIEDITTSMTGKDVETVSFVSQQNTNIKSVQFVIQTEGIEIETIEEVETPEPEKLNFWQKLLKLFGWD